MRGKGEGSIWERERGVFVARLTVGYNAKGNPRRTTRTFTSKKDAQAWLADQQVKLAGGQLAEPHRVTVKTWVAQYLDGLTIRENTRYDYDKALKPVIDDLGDVRLRDLTPARVQAQLNAWTKTRTPYQNRKTMRALKAALAEATRLELLARNPAAPVRLPRVERGTILVWTGEEAAQVLRHAREVEHPLSAYLHVNLTTGLRREEMLGLRWGDLDLSGHALRVRQTCTYITGKPHLGPPKTRAGRRTVALDEETVRVLSEWRGRLADTRQLAKRRWQEHDLVFPSSIGTPAAESRLAAALREVMRAAGVPVIRLYDLRHSYASLAYERGVPLKLIGDRLGHTNVAFTLQTYVHARDSQRRAAALPAAELFGPLPVRSATGLPHGAHNEQDAVPKTAS